MSATVNAPGRPGRAVADATVVMCPGAGTDPCTATTTGAVTLTVRRRALPLRGADAAERATWRDHGDRTPSTTRRRSPAFNVSVAGVITPTPPAAAGADRCRRRRPERPAPTRPSRLSCVGLPGEDQQHDADHADDGGEHDPQPPPRARLGHRFRRRRRRGRRRFGLGLRLGSTGCSGEPQRMQSTSDIGLSSPHVGHTSVPIIIRPPAPGSRRSVASLAADAGDERQRRRRPEQRVVAVGAELVGGPADRRAAT